MTAFFGKIFASITLGISSLFGIPHAQPVEPVSVPTSTTTATPSVSSTTGAAVVAPVPKPLPSQVVVPATATVKPQPVANTQPPVPNTSSTQSSPVVTTAPVVAPVETPKPVTPPLPKVKVTVSPSSVAYDGTATISWVATDALSCALDSSPVLLTVTGSQSITPTDSKADWSKTNEKTYIVTCTGAGGSASGKATVTVQPWVPPAGYKILPWGQCTFATAPCITGPNGLGCSKDGCGG